MIELSGLDPDRDIEIEEVGRRPGEKLHEELFNAYERPRPTATEKIVRAEREPLAPEVVEEVFAEINLLVLEGDAAGLAAKVADLTSRVREPAGAPASPVPADRRRVACAPHTLWRRMTALLPALSLSNKLLDVGALAACAALLGIAILSLLIFSQARELKRLREWAGRAPERAAELDQRVAAEAAMRAQRPVQPVIPRATPLIARSVAGQPPATPPPTVAPLPAPVPGQPAFVPTAQTVAGAAQAEAPKPVEEPKPVEVAKPEEAPEPVPVVSEEVKVEPAKPEPAAAPSVAVPATVAAVAAASTAVATRASGCHSSCAGASGPCHGRSRISAAANGSRRVHRRRVRLSQWLRR